jgi:hypothetical protein
MSDQPLPLWGDYSFQKIPRELTFSKQNNCAKFTGMNALFAFPIKRSPFRSRHCVFNPVPSPHSRYPLIIQPFPLDALRSQQVHGFSQAIADNSHFTSL